MTRFVPVCALLIAFCVALSGCSAAPTSTATTTPKPGPEPGPNPAATTARPTPTPPDPVQTETGAPPQSGCERDCEGPIAQFDTEIVGEASGAVISARDPDLLWVLDDGPGTTSLLGVRLDPQRGRQTVTDTFMVEIEGLEGRDTEALAADPCSETDDRACVFIGDIGDNNRKADAVTVHRVVEPDTSTPPDAALPMETARFTYPDGATDAEALIVQNGRLFIVGKAQFDDATRETAPTDLFVAESFADSTLTSLGTIPLARPKFPLAADIVGNVVTGADSVPGRVLLRTYDHALLFTAPGGDEADLTDLPQWPFEEIPTDGPLQTEAIAFDSVGCAHLTVGESSGVVWRTRCP